MATETTREILNQEGGELALAELAGQVRAAEDAIKALLLEDGSRTWTIRELQDAAANGFSSSVVNIAFLRLLQGDLLAVGADLTVRAL